MNGYSSTRGKQKIEYIKKDITLTLVDLITFS